MFHPKVREQLTVKGRTFVFSAQPDQPDTICARHGTDAIVYMLEAGDGSLHALKVFHEPAQFPDAANRSKALTNAAGMMLGLEASRRLVIEPKSQAVLLEKSPGLLNAIIMTWIPGESWHDLMCAGPLSPEKSTKYAQSLARVLAGLESCGIAHCSLGRDHILAADQGVSYLVDLEDLFLANMSVPVRSTSSPASYRHPHAEWVAEGDRFAAAVLFAECLCWSDERIVNAAFGADGFFDPQELQQDSQRFKLLVEVLEDKHGTALRHAFEQAWFSKSLADCPPLSVWGDLLGLRPVTASPGLKSTTIQQSLAEPVSMHTRQPGDMEGVQPRPKRPVLNRTFSAIAVLTILLLTAGLGYSVYDMDRIRSSLDRAEATMEEQADAILDYKDQLRDAQSTIDEQDTSLSELRTEMSTSQSLIADYQSQVNTLKDQVARIKADLIDTNGKISDLEDSQPIRLTVVNEFGQAQYIGIDGIAFIYVRARSSASFYLKPGSYTLTACHPSSMVDYAGCAKWGEYNLRSDRTVTINK